MRESDPPRKTRRALRLLSRGWRLCCPRCGARTLFHTWLTMHRECGVCSLRFEREQGFFLGAIYINYGLTIAIALIGYFVLEAWTNISLVQQLILWGSVSLLCPLLLFRRARGVWLSFDYIFNPVDDEWPTDEGWHRERSRF